MNNQGTQRGKAGPIFALLIVPILALVLLIGVEIAGILSMVRSFETRLDRVALIAGRHLPDASAAIATAQVEMVKLGENIGGRCNSITPSSGVIEGGIVLKIECMYVPRGIASLGIGGAEWRFQAKSEVVRAATDLMLLIDSSAYLGPRGGVRWGSEPSSTYFREMYGDTEEALLRTQQCNNPVIRGIKRFALAAYPKYINAHSGRIGIGFFPGNVRDLDGSTGGSPYLSVVKNLNHSAVTEANYAGVSGSDHECRQVSDFEFDHQELFSIPEYAMRDPSGIGTQIWGKVISDNNSHLTGNTWMSLMEGFRYGAGGSLTGDLFGSDRELNVVVLAGDVPRSGGERFPWIGGIGDQDRDEFLRVLSSGRNVNLLYLIYAPADIDTGLDGIHERAKMFATALHRVSEEGQREAEKGRFRSIVEVYRDENSLLTSGLDLVRRNAGRIVLRRLQ